MSEEHDLERRLSEWLADGPLLAPRAPLAAALGHAAVHPRKRSLVGLIHGRLGRLLQAGPGGSRLALAAVRLVAAVVIVTTAAALVVLQRPVDRSSPSGPGPTGITGGSGSLWLDDGNGAPMYYLVHADGTLVIATGNGSIGLGVWQPTGERSLAATWVLPDADPSPDVRLGTATYRSEWLLDEAAGSATVTFAATFERADGAAVPDAAGTFDLTRLHLAPMPPDARFPTPPEPAWAVAHGSPVHGNAAAGVFVEPADPAIIDVIHADGTSLNLNPHCGSGVGLWAPTGERDSVSTVWSAGGLSNPLVGESTFDVAGRGFSGRYGTSVAFAGVSSGAAMRIDALDPEAPLAPPDPAHWPALGRVWVEPVADGLATRSAYLADGTVISVHPEYGEGVGLWQPTGPDTLVSDIRYRNGRVQLRAQSTVDAAGETLSTRYVLKADSTGMPETTGTSTATRLRLQPLTPTRSPMTSPS